MNRYTHALLLTLAACTESAPGGGDTALAVDCRAFTDQFGFGMTPECGSTAEAGSIGSGPRVILPSGGVFFDKGKFVLGSSGGVFTVDIATGTRSFLTGRYEDPANGLVEVGTGPEINPVMLVKAPDGSYVGLSNRPAGGYNPFRVDPATGTRTDFSIPQCSVEEPTHAVFPSNTVNQTMFPLAVAPGGRVTSYMTEPFGFDGRGITAVVPAGDSGTDQFGDCEFLTWYTQSTPSLAEIGNGPDLYLNSHMEYGPDGMLYVLNPGEQSIVKVDPVSHNRMVLSMNHQGITVGEGERLVNPGDVPESAFTIHEGAIWAFYTSFLGGFTRIDLVTGDRTGADFELRQARPRYCAAVPERPGIFACYGGQLGGSSMVFLLEPATGNFNIISN